MGRCLGTALSSVSVVMRDNTPQGVTPGSPDSMEGRNSVNSCSSGASEESIGIYVTTPESTIGEGGLPSHSQVSRCDSRESRGGVASVGASSWGLPHPRKPVWRAGLPKKARVSQEWPWVSREWPWMTRE